MKKTPVVVALALVIVLQNGAVGQTSQADRKAFREYTSPQELVSIAPTTTLDKALSAISEVSQKFVGKIIIDTERRAMPINVDIQGMQWRDALETICRKNDLWYTEYENYLQITGSPGAGGLAGGAGGEYSLQPGRGGLADAVSARGAAGVIERERVSFRSREIKVSAVFFDVSLNRLEEVGVNWTFMKTVGTNTGTIGFGAEAKMGDKVSDKIFKAEIVPNISFANMSFIAQFFSNYSLGEILSGPQLIVRSGEEGKIQVGQDFSIRERDFAGNLIDRFYNTGTIVRVKPQVVTEQGVNFIHMEVNVERSSVAPGQFTTIIDKTAAVTNILLLDGEETIIGGLYNTTTNTIRQGVPFLKDLPWYVFGLRYLFGYDKDETVKHELIILLKAELVPTLQERITQKLKEDNVFGQWQQEQAKSEEHVRGKKPVSSQ